MDILDKYGRSFKTLRISLTNTCNLGCIYCVDGDRPGPKRIVPNKTFSYTEIARAVKKIHDLTNLETVRLTGGEPTLYKDLLPLVKEIQATGIHNIKMTSNGYLLAEQLPDLSKAGLKKINISLDTLDEENFYLLSGKKNLAKVLEAIEKALELKLEVKINAVILKGINEEQIVPLLNFSSERNITIRFLELMRMGPLYQNKKFDTYFVPEEEILKKISAYISYTPLLRKDSSTANYWITKAGHTFGIIANESNPFCHDCNRLRLDSYGNIYGCLSNSAFLPVNDLLDDETKLREQLRKALLHKQEIKFTGSSISMMAIGG